MNGDRESKIGEVDCENAFDFVYQIFKLARIVLYLASSIFLYFICICDFKLFLFLKEKKTKIALNQVFVPKLALKVKSHKNNI